MKDNKIFEIISNNKGIIIGGIVGLLIYLFGLMKLVTLAFLIFLGMVVGNTIEKNKGDIKEKIKQFIDKF